MLCPHVHIPFEKIREYLSYIKEHRLNLEIYLSGKTLDSFGLSDISNIKKMLDHDPALTIHGPFMDLSPGAVDRKVRQVTYERFSHVLDIADALKPVSVVFHSGYEKWKYGLKTDIWLEESIKTWSPLIEKAKGMGVKLAIENIFEDSPENLRLLMKALGSEHFGICFDTGHFNLFSKLPLGDWLESLKSHIIELHVHDNDKTHDSHLPIGEGTFNFNELFAALEGMNLIYTIESHTPEKVLKSINTLRAFSSGS